MGRRNVLGNQIESSKSMWIVLLGMLAGVLQLVLYQLVNDGWLGLLLGGVCLLVGSAIIHFITGEQEELFSYLLIPCIFSGCIGLLIPHLATSLLPSSGTVLLGSLLAWLIPVLYACIFTWAAGISVLGQFAVFYKKASIFFYLVYFGLLIYWFGWRNRIPGTDVKVQLIPFASFAAYIDGMLTNTVSVERLLFFLAERILLFMPYGFLIAMVCRKLHSVLRLLFVLLLPLLLELLQLLLGFNTCSVDDVIFSFLGGLIGMLLFVIFNGMFQRIIGRNFDGSEVERDYYGRKI